MTIAFSTPFTYTSRASRIVFGAGTLARLDAELDELCIRRALILSTPEQRALAERVHDLAPDRCAGIFDRAVMHVPVETAEAGVKAARDIHADGLIAAGGGSTIGLAKAIALDTCLPIVAIPTTYAGSEVTPIYGLTDRGEKRTGKSARVLPRTVLYDASLTLTLPAAASAASGLNAIAHAAEGLYAQDSNPVMSIFAEEGIRSLVEGLPAVCRDTQDMNARELTQYGSWLCGTVLGSVGMALHHKLCHTLGGLFNLPHAEMHSAILPYALAFNLPAVPQALLRMERALGTDDPVSALHAFAHRIGLNVTLASLGVTPADLDRAAEAAMRSPYFNPRPLSERAIRHLLELAWTGEAPTRASFAGFDMSASSVA
ncbi:Maleylacetate reductase [Pararobbsia alpina]|uniref:maleylacetate reductase n=1 Tax=Pararobbsia alpina TaxID=621374 RepID=UPI0039A5EC81